MSTTIMSARSAYLSSSIPSFYAQSSPSPPPTLTVMSSPPPPSTAAIPITPRQRPRSRRQLSITVPPIPGEYLVVPTSKPTGRSPSPLSPYLYPCGSARSAAGRGRGDGCIRSPFALRATLSTPSPRRWISLRQSVNTADVDVEKVPRSALPRFGRSPLRSRVPLAVWLLFAVLVVVSAVYVFLSPVDYVVYTLL